MIDASLAVVLVLGVLSGFAVTLPTGPVNLMILNRVVRFGTVPGIIAGVGAALGDSVYAAAAAFGVGAVTEFVADHPQLIQLVGGGVLAAFGLIVLFHRVPSEAADTPRRGFGGPGAAFLMTVTNPAALFAFAAIFSGLNDVVSVEASALRKIVLVLGVFAGAMGWWVLLAATVRLLRHRFRPEIVAAVNRFSGVALIVLGGWLVLRSAGAFIAG